MTTQIPSLLALLVAASASVVSARRHNAKTPTPPSLRRWPAGFRTSRALSAVFPNPDSQIPKPCFVAVFGVSIGRLWPSLAVFGGFVAEADRRNQCANQRLRQQPQKSGISTPNTAKHGHMVSKTFFRVVSAQEGLKGGEGNERVAGEEPPVRLELTTYALRKRRSTN